MSLYQINTAHEKYFFSQKFLTVAVSEFKNHTQLFVVCYCMYCVL